MPKRGSLLRGAGERVGGIKPRRREDVRLGQQAQPRQQDEGVPPGATRNALGASGRTRSRGRGGAEGNPPTSSVSPGRANFGGINGRSSSSSSDDSRSSSDSSNRNDSEDLPALVGRPAWDLEVFGELPALQGGRTRSQSRGLKCPVGVWHEGRGSREDHGEEGRGNRTSSRFTAGRVPGEETLVTRGAREARCVTRLKILS